MLTLDCMVEAGDWPPEATLEKLAGAAIGAALKAPGVALPQGTEAPEVSLVFTSDAVVRELNAHWRGQDKPTNVLSFAMQESAGPATPMLGDIVFAQETVASEAAGQGKSFEDHLTHLIIHGFLHLLGFDHEEESEAETMEALETNILAGLRIADPYAEQER